MELKEQEYPIDERGRPDLAFYTDPIEHYLDLYEQHLKALADKPGPGSETDLAFERRAHAVWGLIAKGRPAVPHALAMLERPEPEAREDGAAILAALGERQDIVAELVQALDRETDRESQEPRPPIPGFDGSGRATRESGSIVLALGRMRNKAAVPSLARIIRDESQGGDLRRTAAEALGRVVRRPFMKEADPLRAALAWLEKHAVVKGQGA